MQGRNQTTTTKQIACASRNLTAFRSSRTLFWRLNSRYCRLVILWCGVLVCGGQEYVATCVNEAVAIADKLMTLSIIESTSSTNTERFRPSVDSFYVLKVQTESPCRCCLGTR